MASVLLCNFQTLLLVLFIVVLSYGMYLGLDVDCGCFGPEDPERDAFSGLGWAVTRDFMFLIAAAYSWWFMRRSTENQNKGKRYVEV